MPTIFKQVVYLNGVAFNDPAQNPPGALSWGCDVTDGWKNTPDPDVRTTPLGASRDGSSSADFFAYPSRFITLGGWAYAPDAATAELLHDYLLTAALPRNTAVMMERMENVPKFVLGKRAAAFETDWTLPNGFRWSTTFQCDDPLKYSNNVVGGSSGVSGAVRYTRTYPRTYPMVYITSGGGDASSVGVVNVGTSPSSQILVQISGPLTEGGWRLRNDTNNGELSFDVGLASTDILTINFANQTALLNGYPIAYSLTGDFWTIDPGTNLIRLYADYNAATRLTVSARSAWE